MDFAQLTVGNAFKRSVQLYPNKVALVFNKQSYTYQELDQRTNRLAHHLLVMGYQKGDKLAFMLKNCNEAIEILLACAKTGIVAVPINFRLKSIEVEYIIRQSDSRGIIFDSSFAEVIFPFKDSISTIQDYIVIGEKNPHPNVESYQDLINFGPTDSSKIDVNEKDSWYLGYTSGTTGFPKGAMISHRSRILPDLNAAIEWGIHHEDKQLLVMPLFHANGILFSLLGLLLGNTIFIMENFDPEKVLENIKKEKLTYASMVPTMYNMILKLPESIRMNFDVSNMRVLISSSSPLLTVTKEGILKMFHNASLNEFYGSSEAAFVTNLKPKDQKRKIRSVGQPMFGVQVKILDEHGNEVPQGEVGELYSYGPVAEGYYKLPDATKESFHDGWFTAGDMARMDEEGYLYIVDRKKDLIISGGENIYPVEIEEVISKHPSVHEVAVIGIPDDNWGEQVHAVVVCKEGVKVAADELINYTRERLADYKRPRSVEFVNELPKNPTGKVLKRVIRDRYWQGKEAKV